MKMQRTALVLALAFGGVAQAEEARLGAHPAMPEVEIAFDRRLDLRATLTVDRNAEAAVEVTRPSQIRLDLGVRAAGGAAPVVDLTCRFVLMDAGGRAIATMREGPCYAGPVAAGDWTAVGDPVRFRAEAQAPAGAAGVMVTVRDGATRRERKLLVTYGWAPEVQG